MIFSEIDDIGTAFRLACTNTRLMVLGEKRLRHFLTVSNRIGDRIICLGDGAELDDLPEGIPVQGCIDFLRDAPNLPELEKDHDEYGWVPQNIYDWAITSRSEFRVFDTNFWMNQHFILVELFSAKTPAILWRLAEKFRCSYRCIFRDPDLLWNLTKRVYVRREAALKVFSGREGKIDEFNLMGTILNIQICWSSCAATNMRYKDLHRGKWAGDRFEFTGKEVFESRLKEKGRAWKDVSEEVIGTFVDVFKAQDGEKWTESFCHSG